MESKNQSEFFQKYREENDTFIKDYDKRMERLKKPSLTKTQKLTIRLFVVLFFFGLGAATIGTVYFSNFKKQPDPVMLTLKYAESVKSGDLIEYVVTVANKGTAPLSDPSLIIEYPEGFQFESSSLQSDNADHTYWKLDAIPRGSTKELTLKGVISGSPTDQKILNISFHYKIGDSKTEFIAKQNAIVRISEPLVSVRVDGPQLTEVEKEISYSIIYGDLSVGSQQEQISMKIQLPKEFIFTSDPPMDISGGWSDALLKKGFDSAKRGGEIKLKGSFLKDASGDYPIIVQIGTVSGKQLVIADEKKLSVHIAKNPLTLKMLINSSESIIPANMSDEIRIAIQYENATSDELNDVHILLDGTGELIDWSAIDNPSYGALKNGILTWSKKEVGALERILPGQKGEINLSLRLKDMPLLTAHINEQKLAGKSLFLDFKLSATTLLKHGAEEQLLSQEPLAVSIPIQSDSQVVSAIKPIEGNKYLVEWTVQNTLHEISAITLTAPLGKSTAWVGNESRSAGDISYDSDKKIVKWTLNRMPLSVGSIQASFEVMLDKSSNDLVVVDSGSLEAIDSITKGIVRVPIPRSMAAIE